MRTLKIGIIGLGYVGLPLAVEFGKKYETIGFDINENRILELNNGTDHTLEVDTEEIHLAKKLSFTTNLENIRECNIFIVTVPTPIDEYKNPDFTLLKNASTMIGSIIDKDDIVIYESTVYPGATEEICVPILEVNSGLEYNVDFYCGYSPERINPGDKNHKVIDIVKVTSGSNSKIADKVDKLYQSIITAGTHKVSSIKVAEAAKVIENTQRDVNIALINELSIIFDKLNINTNEVLEAAGTKWNFLPFRPGLVGGHCIGVDPYYLTHKALEVGYSPEIILAGRRINDNMGYIVVNKVVELLTQNGIKVLDSKILIMGLTFKENCPDLRNTRVIDLVTRFNQLGCEVDVCDTWANIDDSKSIYNIDLINTDSLGDLYDCIVIAVPHKEYINMGIQNIRKLGKENCVIFDVKGVFPFNQIDGSL